MSKQNEETNQLNSELMNELAELEKELAETKEQHNKVKQSLDFHQQEFKKAQYVIQTVSTVKQKGISFIKAIPAYLLGRRNRKQLYSKAYKRKHAANQLKKYKTYLYDLGFTEKALADLQEMYISTPNKYLQKAISWELALWHANKLTKENAKIALAYLERYTYKETDSNLLRQAAILKAECYDLLGEEEKGRQFLKELLISDNHPDLLLAEVNLEATTDARVESINKALKSYHLQEITLKSNRERPAYYNLSTNPIERKAIDGPKVSVIIPAYNSESGIRLAIESMLAQTWENLEIIVVDDCSTDDTAKVINEYVTADSRVKQLSTPVNSGPYIARNIALQQATGEFVTINDADDWSHPEKIEKQVKHLIDHKKVIANTSEHARLTEELKLYRRGMPGKYIFSNMSSIMFRRAPVLKKVGYWDSVRFAADSEYKNRLIAVFGKETVVDLHTGPLSFPMQSAGSLTASSAFGYDGFLMGVRKEYAESYRLYHKESETLYLPFPQDERPFPVPEPMRINRKTERHIDLILISDFRRKADEQIMKQIETHKEMGLTTGLIQMGQYDFKLPKQIDSSYRKLIDGEHVQMLVYGETISCDVLMVNNPAIFQEKQKYVPKVIPKVVRVIVSQLPKSNYNERNSNVYNLRQCARNISEYVHRKAKWYPINQELRELLMEHHLKEVKSVSLSTANWMSGKEWNETSYIALLENWFVDDNPYELG